MDTSIIEKVEIIYENCEVYTIKANLVREVIAKDPKYKYELDSFPSKRYTEVSHLGITIEKRADISGSMSMEETRKPFERTLSFRDIVYVLLFLKNGTIKKIIAPWEGDSYEDNPNQETILNKDGSLTIHIKENMA